MAILTVGWMTPLWKKRLTSIAAATALAGLAASCSAENDDAAATPIDTDTATTTTTTTTTETIATTTTTTETAVTVVHDDQADEPSVVTTQPTTTQPTTTEATVEPEQAGVDIASFEEFELPDYVAAVVGEGYSSYMIEVEPGIEVHVLEVGSGYPVYLQHGAPTSGLLYRQVAELLPPDQFRVIMPTMVGLGFSTKVSAEQHTLDNHVRWMNEALNALQLDELIYGGHDWGGPVGLGALARSPELMQGAVVLNTALGAPTGPVEFAPPLAAVMAPLPLDAELALAAAIFDQLPGFQNDPSSMSPDVLDLYRRPVSESDDVIGPLALVRMAADGPEHPTAEVLREIDTYLAQLGVPAEIVWGINDPILGDRLDAMIEIFPNAPVTRTDAGHFLQEEVGSPEEIAAAIQRVRDQLES